MVERVRLGVNDDGTLTAHDFFSPANNAKLDQDDADLGSGGPIALPDDFGTPSHPHLLVVAGKDGVVWPSPARRTHRSRSARVPRS